jgi:hypothetical protein
LRHDGHQFVRVEHVHVNDGGQAVVGNVKTENAKERGKVPFRWDGTGRPAWYHFGGRRFFDSTPN